MQLIRVPTLVVSMLISTVDFVAFAIDVTIQQAHAYFDHVLSWTISMDVWRLDSSSPTTPFEPNPISLDVVFRCFYGVPGIHPRQTLMSSLLYQAVVIGSGFNGQRYKGDQSWELRKSFGSATSRDLVVQLSHARIIPK